MNRNSKNLHKHEIIGLEVKVTGSDCSTFKGMVGKVVDETYKTVVIETESGEKVVPKKGKHFSFTLNDENIKISGDRLLARPQDRTKLR